MFPDFNGRVFTQSGVCLFHDIVYGNFRIIISYNGNEYSASMYSTFSNKTKVYRAARLGTAVANCMKESVDRFNDSVKMINNSISDATLLNARLSRQHKQSKIKKQEYGDTINDFMNKYGMKIYEYKGKLTGKLTYRNISVDLEFVSGMDKWYRAVYHYNSENGPVKSDCSFHKADTLIKNIDKILDGVK